jgi:hypothetical protein
MALVRTTLLFTLLAAAGCADTGGQTLVVLNNAVPEPQCVISPAEGGAFIPTGRVDTVGVTDYDATIGYLVTPTIKNLADSQDGNLSAQRTVILQGAKVDLTVGTHPDGTELLTAGDLDALNAINALKFTAPFSGAIDPDGGLAGVAFELVPIAVIEAIAPKLADRETALITASFTVFGKTVGGSGVEADPFVYPVTVCNGCLFTDLGSCVLLPDGDYPAGNPCNVFQDAPGTCCTSSAGLPVCPAVPEMGGA